MEVTENKEYPKVQQEIYNADNENLQKLASLFPAAVKDGQLDIDALKEELGQFEEVTAEKYELNWAGKQNAKKEARKNPLGKTLKYVKGDGIDEDSTENLYIEGDNLEVLKLLKKNYYGSIKMIYIDPPYNTGSDSFLYRDNFSVTQEEIEQLQGERDESGIKMVKNTKDSARFHTRWLNEMYPSIKVAKDLLTDDGVIFISIDDNEVDNLKKICNEIFSEDNFIAQLIWEGNGKNDSRFVSIAHEYILIYVKSKEYLKEKNITWRAIKNGINEIEQKANELIKITNSNYKEATELFKKWFSALDKNHPSWKHRHYNNIDEQGVYFAGDISAESGRNRAPYQVMHPITQKACKMPTRGWPTKITMDEWIQAGLVDFGEDENFVPKRKRYLLDTNTYVISSVLYKDPRSAYKNLLSLLGGSYFDNPKDIDIMTILQEVILFDNDIILDFFSGSATTAHACMQLNAKDNGSRKFICVQLPEKTYEVVEGKEIPLKNSIDAYNAGYKNICEIGKERIRRAGEKIKEEIEQGNQQLKLGEEPKKVSDIGFKVLKVADTTLNWEKKAIQGDSLHADYLPGTIDKDRLDFTPGFNDPDVVYEIMLRQEGVPLTSKIETLTEIGSRTYLVADSYLISLEESINSEMVDKLSKIEPLPFKFVFRDSAFDDDIALKDETFRRLNALIDKNKGGKKQAYTVEFI